MPGFVGDRVTGDKTEVLSKKENEHSRTQKARNGEGTRAKVVFGRACWCQGQGSKRGCLALTAQAGSHSPHTASPPWDATPLTAPRPARNVWQEKTGCPFPGSHVHCCLCRLPLPRSPVGAAASPAVTPGSHTSSSGNALAHRTLRAHMPLAGFPERTSGHYALRFSSTVTPSPGQRLTRDQVYLLLNLYAKYTRCHDQTV